MLKERIIINVYWDEKGNAFYRIEPYYKDETLKCVEGGWFIHESDLDKWLEDHKEEIALYYKVIE